jgi:hypothetical protein
MLKLVALVALFAGFCWFGTQVPLGAHTLFGHLHAIAGTKESQELFDGTRESAKPLVDNVRRRIAGAADPRSGEGTGEHEHEAHAARHPDAGAGTNTAEERSTPPHPESRPASHPEPHPQTREGLTPADRQHLRRLLSSAEGASARP